MKHLKLLGLVLILIGAVVLVLSYFQGWSNSNSVTMGSLAGMIVGLIVYIFASRRCMDKN
ncbi:MAG: hypothetical protein E7090_04355 [Bacteroidales bacterium]|nr:hypothetical protein [Bacteroidales bacterium]